MKQLKDYIVNENNFFKNLGIGMRLDVEKWLNKHRIKNYTINNDLTIDVKGDVDLYRYGKKELPDYIQFGKVDGYFDISYCNNLTTLKGCPVKVGGWFACVDCKNLTSLEGGPKHVDGYFYCQGCVNLTSLKGCPRTVGETFICSKCNIKSLKGCPQEVGGDFYSRKCNKKFTQDDVEKYCKVKGEIIV